MGRAIPKSQYPLTLRPSKGHPELVEGRDSQRRNGSTGSPHRIEYGAGYEWLATDLAESYPPRNSSICASNARALDVSPSERRKQRSRYSWARREP